MAVHSRAISDITFDHFIYGETPTGVINSINKIFVLSNIPRVGTVRIILNGMLQNEIDDYNIVNNIITFIKSPRTNSNILVHYIKS